MSDTTQAPGERLEAQLAGETLAARLDELFGRHFAGTELAGVTRFWNAVHAFKEDVKRLLPAEHQAQAANVAAIAAD